MKSLKTIIFIINLFSINLIFCQKFDISKIEDEIFRIVNVERTKVKLDELRYDQKLADMLVFTAEIW